MCAPQRHLNLLHCETLLGLIWPAGWRSPEIKIAYAHTYPESLTDVQECTNIGITEKVADRVS